MDVNAIRARIVELGHQTPGDAEVLDKALGWLNAAYHELMDEVVVFSPPGLQRLDEVVTDTRGRAVLAEVPYKVLRVVNRDSARALDVVSRAAILDSDPGGAAVGAPSRCLVEGGVVEVHPLRGGVRLAVLYVPAVADLAVGGGEESILLPPAHHHALVWGGLVWSALYERGFSSHAELGLFQRNWMEAKQRVKMSLIGNSGEVLRVRPFDVV